jgi:type VI secretion system protein ImpF
MDNSTNSRRLVSSVIERLLESATPDQESSLRSDGQDLRRLKQDVARDLENLLNTRRRCQLCPPALRELNESIVEYGIPDFTGLNMSVPTERERTRLEFERVIRRFEPRLKNIIVSVQTHGDRLDRTLRLRITGVLRIEPVGERVEFDSQLEPSTAAIAITAVP